MPFARPRAPSVAPERFELAAALAPRALLAAAAPRRGRPMIRPRRAPPAGRGDGHA